MKSKYKVGFNENTIFIIDERGITNALPLAEFPKLQKATHEQINNFTLSPFGIHWEDLDEDLSFDGFLK